MNRNMKFSGFIFSFRIFFLKQKAENGICNCFYNLQEEDTLHDIFKFKKITRRSKILYKWLDKKKQDLV